LGSFLKLGAKHMLMSTLEDIVASK